LQPVDHGDGRPETPKTGMRPLRGVNLSLLKRQIIVFTGVSGSGK